MWRTIASSSSVADWQCDVRVLDNSLMQFLLSSESICWFVCVINVEGNTLRAAEAAAALLMHYTELLFFSSFQLYSLSLSLFVILYHSFLSAADGSICMPLGFFLFLSNILSLPLDSLSLSLPSCQLVISALFESIPHQLSVTIFVSSITLSHSSAHFHSSLFPSTATPVPLSPLVCHSP